MEIRFPINKLLKEKLTPDEYSICILLEEGKTGLLKELAVLKGNSFYDNIKRLNDLEYINYNTIGNIVDIKNITLTDKFKKLTSFEDPFLELYQAFPKSSTRPDGNKDYLRTNKNKARIKYLRVIRNNPLMHEHILKCLSFEKKKRLKEGSMGYFKRLYNWIETEEWTKYEEYIEDFTNATNPQQTESVAYGSKII